MSKKKIATLVALAAGLALVPSASAATVIVDSRDSLPTRGNVTLTQGTTYDVTVTGNFSVYGQGLWNQSAGSYWVTCGATKLIDFRSPGAAGTPAAAQPASSAVGGQDAEYLYAGLAKRGCGKFKPPLAQTGFLLSTDGTDNVVNPTPITGVPAAPAADGEYTYQVVGQNKVPRFLIPDGTRADNSGRLKVTYTALRPS